MNGENAALIEVPKKNRTVFSSGERIMSLLTAVFAFMFVHFALWNPKGLFTTLLFITVITSVIVFLRKNGREFTRLNVLICGLLYIFSLVFTITANNFIKNLDLIFLIVSGAYLVYSVCDQRRVIGRYLPVDLAKAAFEYPFAHFTKEYEAVSGVLRGTKFGPTAKYVVLGLIGAVPLTAVVGALLMSADNGVKKILNFMADSFFAMGLRNILPELFFTIPAALWLFGMLYANLHKGPGDKLDEEKTSAELDKMRVINNIAVYTSVTPICFLYVIFFVSQFSYFMSAFSGDLPSGYSYADYARKGFFELFAIEIINTAVIVFINMFSKKSGRGKPWQLKLYTIVISVFTMLIAVTALSKMVMYIGEYGLTRDRVYASWFIVLTFLCFIPVIISQFRKNFRTAPVIAAIFTVMFGLLCFSRPDAIIAKYNLETGSYDIVSLFELSDDGQAYLFDEKYVDMAKKNSGDKLWEEYTGQIRQKLDNVYSKTNISGYMLSKLIDK